MKNIVKYAGAVLAGLGFATAPLAAQVESVDPDAAFDAPVAQELPPVEDDADQAMPTEPADVPVMDEPRNEWSEMEADAAGIEADAAWAAEDAEAAEMANIDQSATTYREDDLIGAAEGVFGKGAEGVAKMIRKLLADQGEPNAYIVGREAGGAFIVGARYGSGTLFHKVEGEMPVYWTGPSVGFDAGANAGSTFVLVYNLYDTEELYERFPAAEGSAYAVGGLNASYVRKGDVVLIPIRVGAGLRLGVNAGYMKFSKSQKWLPF